MHLAELLERAQHGLPHLELHFTTSQSGEWGSENEPQSSIAPFGDAILANDYEILLHAFCRLRNARSANICVPAGYDKRRYFVDDLAESLTWKEPFGTVLSPGDPNTWNDEELQEETDNILMGLDLSLDLLPGHTANMMRLDRFSQWYTEKLGGESKYEREYEHIIGTWKESSEERRITSRLQWRYGAMRAYDPWQSRRSDRRTRYMFCFADDDDTDDDVTDEWDEDDWHHLCGRRGIPSFESDAFASMASPSFLRERSPWMYEDDFTEKLRGWQGGAELHLVNFGVAIHVWRSWHSCQMINGQRRYWHEGDPRTLRPRGCLCCMCREVEQLRVEHEFGGGCL